MERSRDWLDQAQEDLERGRSALERGFCDWACFSSQQAAGKAVKAVFQKMGAEAWGRSVADLLREPAGSHHVPEELTDRALELDKAYVATRCPNAHAAGSPRTRYTKGEARRLEARRLTEAAASIVEFCAGLLSETR